MQVDGCLFFQFSIASNAPKETLNIVHSPQNVQRDLRKTTVWACIFWVYLLYNKEYGSVDIVGLLSHEIWLRCTALPKELTASTNFCKK